MADASQTVEIIFEAVDRLGAGISSATGRIEGFAGSVEQATQPLANVTLGILKFEAAVLASGVAVTGLAVKMAGDFDASFREITTLVDVPAEALGKFKGELLDYGRESTQSLASINQATYEAISSGVDYVDSLDTVRQAEQLAVAGKATLDSSLKLLLSSLNAYGKGTEEATRFSDLLFQTVRVGVTTIPELGNSLAKVTGLAATAGVSFEELLAGIATLTSTGSATSEAITQIRGAIANILKPTADATALADELGLQFDASALQSKGFAGVLKDVQEATGGNIELMARLFTDVEALNGTLTLTGLGAEKFADNIEAMGNSAGATADAYDKMAGTVEQGGQRIQNAVKIALVQLGDPLLEEFGGIQQAIAEIFNAIGSSVEGGQLNGFVEQIESMFQDIEQTLRDVAKNLPAALEEADFSAFFEGIDQVSESISNLFNGADLSTVEGLVTVIETLGAGFQTLSAFTAGTVDAIKPFVTAIGNIAEFITELDPMMVAVAGSVGGLALAFNTLAPLVGGIAQAVGALAGTGGVIARAAPLLRNFALAFTGPLGITVALGATLPLVADLVAGLLGLETRAETVARTQREAAASAKEHAEQLEAETGHLDRQIETWDEYLQLLRDGTLVWDPLIGKVREAGEATQQATDKQLTALERSEAGYVNYEYEVEQALTTTNKATKATEESAKALDKQAASVEEAEQSWLDIVKATNDFRVAMEEIASDERIATIEANVELNTAQLEADTRRVESIFTSLNTTIQSTGESVTSLFSTLAGDGLSRFQELALEAEIRKESERRDEALALQKELTREQIKQMRAKTEALRNGDGLITIDSNGLEPALEMIMWQIIEKVQLRANAEGAEFLLGI